jgi:GNAT superfamily N-acetyltransferase
MPQEFLDGRDPALLAEGMRRVWADPGRTEQVLVAEREGRVVGFTVHGPDRDGAAGTGELVALNVHPEVFGTGVATLLLGAAQQELRRAGFARAVLWVVPANARARRFYAREGWTHDGVDSSTTVQGVTVDVTRYSRAV